MEWFYNMLMALEGFDPFVASWCTGIVAVICVYFTLRGLFTMICGKR